MHIARFITDNEALEAPVFASDDNEATRIRRFILSWYLRPGDPSSTDPMQQIQSVYDDLNRTDRDLMKKLLLRLVQVLPNAPPSPLTVIAADIDPKFAAMVKTLCAVDVLRTSADSLFIGDRGVVEYWHPLRQWITEDRAFLMWHQDLSLSARLWQTGGRNESDLLTGKRREEALDWLRTRRDDLDATEFAFIEASRGRNAKTKRSGQIIIDLPGGGFLYVTRTFLLIAGAVFFWLLVFVLYWNFFRK